MGTVTKIPEGAKLVPGYECYCVTPDGQVWTRFQADGRVGSTWSVKVLERAASGHLRAQLYAMGAGGKPRKFLVHVLVLELFKGPRPLGMEACHNDGDPANNAAHNLRWDTRAGNWADRKRHGRGCGGEKNPGGGKLRQEDVDAIRARRAAGEKLRSIAASFMVSMAMVSKIARRRAWNENH